MTLGVFSTGTRKFHYTDKICFKLLSMFIYDYIAILYAFLFEHFIRQYINIHVTVVHQCSYWKIEKLIYNSIPITQKVFNVQSMKM